MAWRSLRAVNVISAVRPSLQSYQHKPWTYVHPRYSSCAVPDDEKLVRDEVARLRAGDIARELRARGVDAAGIFEKTGLIEKLVRARLVGNSCSGEIGGGPQSSGACSSSSTTGPSCSKAPGEHDHEGSSETRGAASSTVNFSESLEQCKNMSAGEIRKQLKLRGARLDDLFEKEDMAQRLAEVLTSDRQHFCRSGRVLPGRVADLSGPELTEELGDDSTPLLLDVHAEAWCGPCRAMAPSLDAAAAQLGRRARVVKLDSDVDRAAAGNFRVRAFPTIIVFGRSGTELARREGALSEEDLVRLVESAAKV